MEERTVKEMLDDAEQKENELREVYEIRIEMNKKYTGLLERIEALEKKKAPADPTIVKVIAARTKLKPEWKMGTDMKDFMEAYLCHSLVLDKHFDRLKEKKIKHDILSSGWNKDRNSWLTTEIAITSPKRVVDDYE